MMIDWTLPVKTAADMAECPCCGEPYCPECEAHYAECRHPGPHSEPQDVPEDDDA